MLTSRPIYTMLMLRNREGNLFSRLPLELIHHIVAVDDATPDTTHLRIAFKLARSSTTEDMLLLAAMIEHRPQILLQKGFVTTRGGVHVSDVTLYEFFLGEGDPVGAKQIEFGFAKIPNGEDERIRQYEQYRLSIEALAKQVKEKKPVFDLRPLYSIIKKSSLADITEALNINDPNRDVTRNTPLRIEFAKFRRAVQPKRKTAGQMHYEHYTTLQQAFDLLYSELEELTDNYINYEKIYLIFRQIIGYLELKGLPAVDRFGLARAFNDEERTAGFKYAEGSFPDCVDGAADLDLTGLGFGEWIFEGWVWRWDWPACLLVGAFCSLRPFTSFVLPHLWNTQKITDLQSLCNNSHSQNLRPGV